MIGKSWLDRFVGKNIGIVYLDSGKTLFVRGILKDVTDSEIALETDYNVLIIPLESIQKVKVSKTEL